MANNGRKGNNLKLKLMVISLSPLALLTIIRNLSFSLPQTPPKQGCFIELCQRIFGCTPKFEPLWQQFLSENLVLLVVLVCCLIWVIVAIWDIYCFNAFIWADRESGYTITSIEEKEDASLNFFLTLIIPLLMDDIATIQGACTFVCIVVAIAVLLYRTKLFYANPILAMFGYRVYEFQFEQNKSYRDKRLVAVSHGKLTGEKSVDYKVIADGVMFVKESNGR